MTKVVNIHYNFHYESQRNPLRRHTPLRVLNPFRRVSPPRGHDPFRRVSPPRGHDPFRRVSPSRGYNPFLRASPSRGYNPFCRASPDRRTSPDHRHSPHRRRSPHRRQSPHRRHSPYRQHSPQRRSSPSPHRRQRSIGHDANSNQREWSLSLSTRECTPPRSYRRKFNFPRRQWSVRHRQTVLTHQLAAYRRKIVKLKVLRRTASRAMLQCLNGEITALTKLSRAVRGLPLNRKKYKQKNKTRVGEIHRTFNSEADEAAFWNEPDAFEFID